MRPTPVSAILSVLGSLRALFLIFTSLCISGKRETFFFFFFLSERSGRGRCAKALGCCCESSAATYISTRYLSVSLPLSLPLLARANPNADYAGVARACRCQWHARARLNRCLCWRVSETVCFTLA